MLYFGLRPYVVLLAITLSTASMAQQIPAYRPGYHMWGSGMGWFMGPIMMLVFLGLAAAVVAIIIRWVFGAGGASSSSEPLDQNQNPLDILNERFAKGEIDKKEFEERKKVLRDG